MLNERATEHHRPVFSSQKLLPFDPWDTEFWHTSDDRSDPSPPTGWFYEHARAVTSALGQSAADPAAATRLRELRRELADQIMMMDEPTLTVAFVYGLAEAHAATSSSALRTVAPRDESDAERVAQLFSVLAAPGQTWWLQCLLTAMLFCAPQDLQVGHDFEAVPPWFVPAYLEWLRGG
jgi:hypothetical protein